MILSDRQIMRRYWLVVCAVIAVICWGGKEVMVRSAKADLEKSLIAKQTVRQELATAKKSLGEAKAKHLSAYTKGISLNAQESQLAQAEKLLAKAGQAYHPDKIRQLSRSARVGLEKVRWGNNDFTKYLEELDNALAQYKTLPTTADTQIAKAVSSIDQAQNAGFYAWHYLPANRLIAEARQAVSKARTVASTKYESSKPDYLRSYRTSQQSIKLAQTALQSALSVAQLYQANANGIQREWQNYSNERNRYPSAFEAANYLERYPTYACMSDVISANTELRDAYRLLKTSEDENGMVRQQFNEASTRIAEASSVIANSGDTFTSAINKKQEVVVAIATIHGASRDAKREIENAKDHINANSQNSQSTAKNYLDDARDSLRQAKRMKDSDPIRALALFRQATDNAESAYSAVDTSDDSDSSWSIGSSSASSSSDNGGSSGFGGFGGGSSSGGIDFGGSSSGGVGGGGVGGPSGGDSGGPSGGDTGGGRW